MNCRRPGCQGAVVDGSCDDCGLADRSGDDGGTSVVSYAFLDGPTGGPVVADLRATPSTPLTPSARVGSSSIAWRWDGLSTESGASRVADPTSLVMSNPEVPEHRRYCAGCNEPVGRARDGEIGRAAGFCRRCGRPFSFAPTLAPGEIVADQYEVVGCLAHGGMGWIYLARVRKVGDLYVVLKGLLDTGDEHAVAAAVAERQFLAEVEHPNIVKIHNFVEHRDEGYIVMEYVNGVSLRELLDDRRPEPFPVIEAISYCLDILPALGHLHDLGLAFCDFKPDNVMRTRHSLKLIDLGGVFRIGDATSAIFGTPGYQAPEVAATGPTVASDLYTVARTLAVMCIDFADFQGVHLHSLPLRHEVPLFVRYDSLYRLLERATAIDPRDRFQTAADLAAQLLGVRSEIEADLSDVAGSFVSNVFTPKIRGSIDRASGRSLPVPIVHPDDPHAGTILSLASAAPEQVVSTVEAVDASSIELELWLVRALLEMRETVRAAGVLDEIDRRTDREWRTTWYRGVLALDDNEPTVASDHFERVYRLLPGEVAPKLAMAMAYESGCEFSQAAHWYRIVTRTDATFTAAAFGLARCLSEIGDRSGAIAAYGRVSESSSAYLEARSNVVRLLVGSGATSLDDAVAAGEIAGALELDTERRLALNTEILEAALDAINGGTAPTGGLLLGRPITERDIRLGLEQAYRRLARLESLRSDRVALIDRANQVRPRTLV